MNEALRELEKAFEALSKDDEKAKKLLSKEIEKNRVFEIILKSCANIRVGKYETKDRYYITINYLSSDITKEEYDLLKEILK